MTQVGEGGWGTGYPVPPDSMGGVPTSGSPVGGEVIAERYQLEQHVNTDSSGRQIWRGVDVILRRPIAVVVRYPGGPAASQMLQAAVEASRIVHPNLVGVYDAIDEDVRAYVVREWIDGSSLRDHIAIGLFDTERALAVAHAVSAAVTAVHSTGMTHGNIHPGTVMIGLDGRVVLADARADGAAPWEEDVRAVGGLLYFSLTGYWPHAEVAGPAQLPDAMRDPGGGLATPRQVRAGVPDFLDNLTMDLLDRRLAVPSAEVLAGEFGRLDTEPAAESARYDAAGYSAAGYYDEPAGYAEPSPYDPAPAEPARELSAGPLRLSSDPRRTTPKPSGRKIAAGLVALLLIGVVGLLVGLNLLTGDSGEPGGGPGAGGGTSDPSAAPTTAPETAAIALAADQVRILDAPPGTRTELDGAEFVVDDDLSTGWQTERYDNSPAFGGLKDGMGILINLGEPTHVAAVRVELATGGATAELRVGDTDPGDSEEGDGQILDTYQVVGEPQQGGSTMVFNLDSDQTYQYLLVFFTELPPAGDSFQLEVLQVTVEGY